jgi:hypothetical protein
MAAELAQCREASRATSLAAHAAAGLAVSGGFRTAARLLRSAEALARAASAALAGDYAKEGGTRKGSSPRKGDSTEGGGTRKGSSLSEARGTRKGSSTDDAHGDGRKETPGTGGGGGGFGGGGSRRARSDSKATGGTRKGSSTDNAKTSTNAGTSKAARRKARQRAKKRWDEVPDKEARNAIMDRPDALMLPSSPDAAIAAAIAAALSLDTVEVPAREAPAAASRPPKKPKSSSSTSTNAGDGRHSAAGDILGAANGLSELCVLIRPDAARLEDQRHLFRGTSNGRSLEAPAKEAQ